MSSQIYTSSQAAEMLGITRARLIQLIRPERHPELRPTGTFGNDLVWTSIEIARVAVHLDKTRRAAPGTGPKALKKKAKEAGE